MSPRHTVLKRNGAAQEKCWEKKRQHMKKGKWKAGFKKLLMTESDRVIQMKKL